MNVCICDDELNILEQLKEFLISFNDKLVIKVFDNVQELQEEIKENNVDILFMDIKLKDNNGIAFIKENKQCLRNTKIVYITGFDEYIEDTFETDPVFILRKPLSNEKVKKAILKAQEKINNENKYITVKVGKEIIKLKSSDIYYIESSARLVNIHLENEVITTYEKLSVFENILTSDFLRIHKSFLVNMNKIIKYKNKEIVLENNELLSISRNYFKSCRTIILNYLENFK